MENLIAYFQYLGASAVLLGIGLAIYAWITPYREFTLIREGNTAAACSLGGTALGLALAIASAAAHSLGLADMVLWAVVALASQLALFLLMSRAIPELKQAIVEGRISLGIMLGTASMAVGILNAGALTY